MEILIAKQGMEVSCKVSHSVILFLQQKGVDLSAFFENLEVPVEILKDPSSWISDEKMENFLRGIRTFSEHPVSIPVVSENPGLCEGEKTGKSKHDWCKNPVNSKSQILEEKVQKTSDMNSKSTLNDFREVGQNNFNLQAWGVLDTVLKMMESPREIFFRPDRFLSYFLSPHPHLDIEILENHKIQFRLSQDLNIPMSFSYILGALEGLPNYMDMESARITSMDQFHFQILWSGKPSTGSLFDEEEKKKHQFHPEIVQAVIESLKKEDQKNIKNKDQQMIHKIFEKMVAIEVEKRMAHWIGEQKIRDQYLLKIKDDFYKMYDYFTRAKQIITLISPSARKAVVREAMRRVDWDFVQKNFPKMVENACQNILSIQESSKTGFSNKGDKKGVENA